MRHRPMLAPVLELLHYSNCRDLSQQFHQSYEFLFLFTIRLSSVYVFIYSIENDIRFQLATQLMIMILSCAVNDTKLTSVGFASYPRSSLMSRLLHNPR